MSTHRKKDANIFMPLLWGNLMKKHFHPGRAPSNPGNSAKHTETGPSDCSPRLLQGPTRRTTWTVPWWASSGLRATPWTARMPTTKCSPLWYWRLGLISLSRVVYHSLLGLVWYGIDGISMLIDIDCILVWLTRLTKYIYIDCIVYLWLVVFKDLLEVGKCSVLSRSNVECENCGWQSNASAANLDAGVHSAEVIIQCHDALLSTSVHLVHFEWLYRTANALSCQHVQIMINHIILLIVPPHITPPKELSSHPRVSHVSAEMECGMSCERPVPDFWHLDS